MEGKGKRSGKINEELNKLQVEMKIVRKEMEIKKKIRIKKNDTTEIIEQFLHKELKVKAEVSVVATKGVNDEMNTVVIEMKDWEAKQEVMREKTKLGKKKIFIHHDMTEEKRILQRISRKKAREE